VSPKGRARVEVDIDPRGFSAYLSIKNTGQSAASEVLVLFDTSVDSSFSSNNKWLEAPVFTSGFPQFAPGREIRYFLDSFLHRQEAGLPSRYEGKVQYKGPQDRIYSDKFVIDFTVYNETSLTERGMDDLVKQVEHTQKAIVQLSKVLQGRTKTKEGYSRTVRTES
jgi:hypothetical protein